MPPFEEGGNLADRGNGLQHHRPRAGWQPESAGGWSSRLGDQGSGYWIGLHSVRRGLSAHDREQPTQILEKVGEIWGTKTIEDFVSLGDSTPDRTLPRWLQWSMNWPRRAIRLRWEFAQAAADLVDFVLLVCANCIANTRLRARFRGLDRWCHREDDVGARAFLRRPGCRGAPDAGWARGGGASGGCPVAGQAAGGIGGLRTGREPAVEDGCGNPASLIHSHKMQPAHDERAGFTVQAGHGGGVGVTRRSASSSGAP